MPEKQSPSLSGLLDSAVVQVSCRYRTEYSGDECPVATSRIPRIRAHDAVKNRMTHRVTHQCPTFQDQKDRQQRTGWWKLLAKSAVRDLKYKGELQAPVMPS